MLYHLTDPVQHLHDLAAWTRDALMLDTHVAPLSAELETYTSAGRTVRYWTHKEDTRDNPFAGMRPTSRWLTEEDLLACLEAFGFSKVEVAQRRDERNGPRVLIHAKV